METTFHVYQSGAQRFTNTVFDLLSGSKEVSQTKGLAFILSEYPEAVISLLKVPEIRRLAPQQLTTKMSAKKIVFISVSAERYTVAGDRADIVVQIHTQSGDKLALIIEAKNINVTTSATDLENQIQRYLAPGAIPELRGYHKIGVALTMQSYPLQAAASVQWSTVVTVLSKLLDDMVEGKKKQKKTDSQSCRQRLLSSYIQFIIRAGRQVQYFQEEVLSVPAGGTLHLIRAHGIHATPATQQYNYRRALFITFRAANGGAMDELYRIEDVVVFNPMNPAELINFQNSAYPQSLITRIMNYIAAARQLNGNGQIAYNGTHRFYVLSTNPVRLPVTFYPRLPGVYHTYYNLNQMIQPCPQNVGIPGGGQQAKATTTKQPASKTKSRAATAKSSK